MAATLLWVMCGLAVAAAQDPYGVPAVPFQGLPGLQQLQQLPLYQQAGFPLAGPSGAAFQPGQPLDFGGLQQQQQQQDAPVPDPRTGPISFGPEHARPATTTPNPFRQGPLVQAALQQQRLQQQLQQQQLAFATPSNPSARYASLPAPAPASAPASAPAGPTGFAAYGAFAPLAPSGPGPLAGPEQPAPSSYAYAR